MSEVERSAAEAFDTWGRENLEHQKHRWFQESECWSWDQDVASLEFKRRGGCRNDSVNRRRGRRKEIADT